MNVEKYGKIHDEIIKRLQVNKITIESAKELNDLAFIKYIKESTDNGYTRKQILNIVLKMLRSAKIKYLEILPDLTDKLDSDTVVVAHLNFRQYITSNNNDMSFTVEPTESLIDTIEKINKELKQYATVDYDGNPKELDIFIEFK